ncbi:MAG: hypothetical protein DELT_01583 [Desulfovibrio sp.]
MKALTIFIRTAAFLAVILLAAPQFAAASPADDQALQDAVADKLMKSKSFDATSVIVNAKDGAVELRGHVIDMKEVTLIKEATESVPGVRSVNTEIDVIGNQN